MKKRVRIDGRCYYFDSQGYCLINEVTPDGYTVDGTGAWAVNGVVQYQAQEPVASAEENPLEGTYVGYNQIAGYTTTIVIPAEGPLYYKETGEGRDFSHYFDYDVNDNEIWIVAAARVLYYDVPINIEPDGNLTCIDYAEEGPFSVWFMKQ